MSRTEVIQVNTTPQLFTNTTVDGGNVFSRLLLQEQVERRRVSVVTHYRQSDFVEVPKSKDRIGLKGVVKTRDGNFYLK